MRKLGKNWLTAVFILVIALCCLTTVVLSCRQIGGDVYSGVKQNIKQKGIGLHTPSDTLSVVEGAFTDNLYGKSYWIEALGLFNKITGKSIVPDSEDRYTVYRMKNGQETWNYTGYDTAEFAEKYNVFAADMKERGIPLLYIQAPFKVDKYDNELPYGITDETNPLADNFLRLISEYDTLDLREAIHESGADYASLFYDTDHHWTPETGLWASGVVAQALKDRYGTDLDGSLLDKDCYTYKTYPNYFLGSQGKRAGLIYSGTDDFVLIEPKYDTDYHVEIPALDIVRDGTYSETVLFKKYLAKDLFNGDPGRVYTGDNYALMAIRNRNAANHTKILLIKDSFSKSVIPFLASVCEELYAVDLRTFKGSVSEFAAENGIDAAVVLYNPSMVVNPEFFEFY